MFFNVYRFLFADTGCVAMEEIMVVELKAHRSSAWRRRTRSM
jgi:hypothetical protein